MTDKDIVLIFFIYLATFIVVILINILGVIIHNKQLKKMYKKHNEEMERIFNYHREESKRIYKK
jgi:hypothetical protein